MIIFAPIKKMNTSIDKSYAPGLTETVAAAVVASADRRLSHSLGTALREVGIAVKETMSPAEIPAEGGMCNLFIIDADTPSQPGPLELLKTLRSQASTAGAALVMLSRSDLVEAYDAGVDLVLSKPVSLTLFLARIRSVLRRYKIIL